MKSEHEEECVLCCREISIYATGSCDHPVCYECSTRMRILCETNECPICRSNMPMVIFTHVLQPYLDICGKFSLMNEKYNFVFEDENIKKAFELLLRNQCKICEESFPSFQKLKEHMKRIHELHYCDLCSDNLKIFTFERKCYNRKDLATHKRIGDADETSHRGHPLCEICDQRYLDTDDLFRHLRREHYFCHFCDADLRYNFFKNYEYLKVHFRVEHFLCEEEECAQEKFIGAFRTEIDLRAHIAQKHYRNRSKAEVKQTRLLEFEFSYANSNRPSGSSSPRGGRYSQMRKRCMDESNSRESRNQKVEAESIDTGSVQDFPYLSEESVSNCNPVAKTNSTKLQSYGRNSAFQRKDIKSEEDFPALSSSSNASKNQSQKTNSLNRLNHVPVRSSILSRVTPESASSIRYSNTSENTDSNTISNPNSIEKNRQKPGWVAKKEGLKFEDEFPKLEGKNRAFQMPDNAMKCNNESLKTTLLGDANHPTSIPGGNNPPVDHFVVIKKKSKKKKNSKIPPCTGQQDELGDFNQNRSSDLQTSYLRSKNLLLNGQENTEPSKKNIIRPVSPHRVENCTWSESASFAKDDFPPLAPSEPIRQPPGFNSRKKNAPPPGFAANANVSKPLNISLSSIARQIVIPSQNKTKVSSNNCDFKEFYRTYLKPTDFDSRNELLIKKIQELSVREERLFDEFKELSRKFRQSRINASEYYSKCLDVMSEREFLAIFPDLVSLLPDIEKQQELLVVHSEFLSRKHGGAVPKIFKINPISVCDICQQVLMKKDVKSHNLAHEMEQ